MICPNCGNTTHRLIIDASGKACANCRGLSEAAGVRIDGTLTRSAARIREQQMHHEGDMIPPHVYDKASKSRIPNPDFLRLYPDKIATNYTTDELKKAGYSKVDKIFKAHKAAKAAHDKQQRAGITYKGDVNAKIKPPV